jgi:hypothetical protein
MVIVWPGVVGEVGVKLDEDGNGGSISPFSLFFLKEWLVILLIVPARMKKSKQIHGGSNPLDHLPLLTPFMQQDVFCHFADVILNVADFCI